MALHRLRKLPQCIGDFAGSRPVAVSSTSTMNPIKHWLLHNQMRVAARLNGARDLTDAHFGALVTHVVFELGGFIIKDGDNFSPVDFSVAAEKAFGKKRYADKARLDRLYGHWGAAPTYLKNASGDYEWGAMAQGLYESTLPLVRPLPRFEAWVAGLRKNYPALTGAGGWLAAAVIGGMI